MRLYQNPILSLMIIATGISLILYVVYQSTEEAVRKAKTAHQERTLKQIFPQGQATSLNSNTWLVCNQRHLIGRIDQITTSNGYAGNITLLVGVRTSGKINTVRVLEHKETPGLGDKIEHAKSPWISQFDAATAHNDWTMRDKATSFDTITAATVTSRAVITLLGKHLATLQKQNWQHAPCP